MSPPEPKLSEKVSPTFARLLESEAIAARRRVLPDITELRSALAPRLPGPPQIDGESSARRAEEATAARIARRFAPRPQAAPSSAIDQAPEDAPLLVLASGVRRLAMVLVLVALVPNLIFASMFWFGPSDMKQSDQPPAAEESSVAAAHAASAPPALAELAVREAAPRQDVTLPLAQPEHSMIADTTSVLAMLPDSGGDAGQSERAGVETESVQSAEDEITQATDGDPVITAAIDPSDIVPLPTRRPTPPSEETGAGWIKALAFVNLRQAPAQSSAVIGVLAKGAKLRVVGRKQRWVQVTSPSTSETGWVYGSFLGAAP